MKKHLLFILLLGAANANAQLISTVAGNGMQGYSGDGSSATTALLNRPYGIVADSSGNIFFSDGGNNCIREIMHATGVITTIAGNGTQGYSGDGGAATSAQLFNPGGLALDRFGNLFLADCNNNRIRKINLTTGIITTVAGIGTIGFSGDGGLATAAQLHWPFGIKVDTSGNIFIADANNCRVRKVDGASGIITTIAGTGTNGYSGDGGIATAAKLGIPSEITLDASGNIYVTDAGNCHIRKITVSTGIITTVAGNGTATFSGDGGLATSAGLNHPQGMVLDTAGNMYISDYFNNRIRFVSASTGIISTLAGTGAGGFNGDNINCLSSELSHPSQLAFEKTGNLLIADRENNRIREIALSVANGISQMSMNTNELNLFPNPAESFITLQSESELGWIKIYNSIGELVYSEKSNSTLQQIDLIDFSSGIYFISTQNKILKLVKE